MIGDTLRNERKNSQRHPRSLLAPENKRMGGGREGLGRVSENHPFIPFPVWAPERWAADSSLTPTIMPGSQITIEFHWNTWQWLNGCGNTRFPELHHGAKKNASSPIAPLVVVLNFLDHLFHPFFYASENSFGHCVICTPGNLEQRLRKEKDHWVAPSSL